MKTLVGISFIILIGLQAFTISKESNNYSKPLLINCDTIPPLNKELLKFVKKNIKKKVGRGQCWDLAAAALELVNASWDGSYEFGRKVNHETECVYPGDIIQFEGVKVKYSLNGSRYEQNMDHHTAVIYKVNSKGNFELAHQNFGGGRKKVIITNLDLKNITKGKFFIYRPTK
ncbi:MAG: hypothetical protein COC01_07820 [Bacteroidetes bacterium]|nr:MAG: hypothetical protein COC01_07820 [Bacteroidota bacterium]